MVRVFGSDTIHFGANDSEKIGMTKATLSSMSKCWDFHFELMGPDSGYLQVLLTVAESLVASGAIVLDDLNSLKITVKEIFERNICTEVIEPFMKNRIRSIRASVQEAEGYLAHQEATKTMFEF